MNCKDCKYYQHDGHYGSCKRYPKVEVKSGGDWCGEFKQMTITLPVVSIEEVKEETIKKRGRPAKENK